LVAAAYNLVAQIGERGEIARAGPLELHALSA
jgi:hypothetical protein